MVVQVTLPASRRVVPWLAAVVGALVVCSLGTQVARHVLGYPEQLGFVDLFDVGAESNLPSWFSSFELLLAAVVLAAIAAAKRRLHDAFAAHWTLLAVVFFAMSVDEVAGIHEIFVEPLRDASKLDGALRYAWAIPGAILAVVFAALALRLLASLPARTRDAFVAAGILFVGGAVGVEMLSGAWAAVHGEENLGYSAIVILEEAMEMLSVVAFIHALLDYARRALATTTVYLSSAEPPSSDQRSSPTASGQVVFAGDRFLRRSSPR